MGTLVGLSHRVPSSTMGMGQPPTTPYHFSVFAFENCKRLMFLDLGSDDSTHDGEFGSETVERALD